MAGICDPTGVIFGLMPHPEAFNHFTSHPDWSKKRNPPPSRQNGDLAGWRRDQDLQ
ncbi:MAG: phosphoribosylformylglycinamidine synthase subunit PurQ [Desulfobacterales bacterium]|nr:phosphoribosylformylglycinamidine synthase subunit PurQ [Desulfobacterales bacterium]